jgi:hypothetical protein
MTSQASVAATAACSDDRLVCDTLGLALIVDVLRLSGDSWLETCRVSGMTSPPDLCPWPAKVAESTECAECAESCDSAHGRECPGAQSKKTKESPCAAASSMLFTASSPCPRAQDYCCTLQLEH